MEPALKHLFRGAKWRLGLGLCSALCLPLSGPGAPPKNPRHLQKPEGATGGLGRPAAPSFQFFHRCSVGTLRDTELRLQCPFLGPSTSSPCAPAWRRQHAAGAGPLAQGYERTHPVVERCTCPASAPHAALDCIRRFGAWKYLFRGAVPQWPAKSRWPARAPGRPRRPAKNPQKPTEIGRRHRRPEAPSSTLLPILAPVFSRDTEGH